MALYLDALGIHTFLVERARFDLEGPRALLVLREAVNEVGDIIRLGEPAR